jgi:hypothetical protein
LCQTKTLDAAEGNEFKCPGCNWPVHFNCGIVLYDGFTSEKIITCFLCYDKFGRAIKGVDDPEYGKGDDANVAAAATTPGADSADATDVAADDTDAAATPATSPSKGKAKSKRSWRAKRPSPLKDKPVTPTETPTRSSTSASRAAAKARYAIRERNTEFDKRNPSFMYPATSKTPDSDGEAWWLDSDGDLPRKNVEPGLLHMAKEPVEEHTYSQVEMEAFSESRKAKVGPQKSFRQIIKAAIHLKSSLKRSSKLDTAPWVHRPDTPYSDQELVHLCCLVDRGRSFSVSTTASRKTSLVTLLVQSYQLNPKLALPYYFGTKKKTIPPIEMEFTVMRAWLKQYLDWFDPDLYQYIQNYTLGLPVLTLPSRMAAHDEVSYEQQGIFRNDRLLVPLPKSHNVVSTEKYFGVRVKDTGRQVDPFCLDSFEKPSKPPKYDQALVASCNPAGFEEIPVARAPSINVPSHQLQIRAIRAQVKGDTVQWVGLQGDRYVSLPS